MIVSLIPLVSSQQSVNYFKTFEKEDTAFKILEFSFSDSVISYRETPELYQFNVTLSKKPTSNIFNFPIETEGLEFYFQPALDQELNIKDYDFVNSTHAIKNNLTVNHRPLNIVGSYAVYKTDKDVSETGKLYHIYRPLIIDSKQVTIWGNLEVTKTFLTIIISQTFLDSAVYPIIIDPSFGYTTIGGSDATYNTNNINANLETLEEEGEIISISAYAREYWGSNPFDLMCAVYNVSGGEPDALLGVTADTEFTGDWAWREAEFASSIEASADDYYICLMPTDEDIYIKYDSSGGDRRVQNTAGSYPDPFGEPTWEDNLRVSIYANYTVSGGQNVTETFYENVTVTSSITDQKEMLKSYGDGISFQSEITTQTETQIILTETISETLTVSGVLYIVTDIIISDAETALSLAVLALVIALIACALVLIYSSKNK